MYLEVHLSVLMTMNWLNQFMNTNQSHQFDWRFRKIVAKTITTGPIPSQLKLWIIQSLLIFNANHVIVSIKPITFKPSQIIWTRFFFTLYDHRITLTPFTQTQEEVGFVVFCHFSGWSISLCFHPLIFHH